jgi:hypothetical protein
MSDMANTTIPTARLIELETAEHERDLLRTELAGLESVRREQAAGRDYWAAECGRLQARAESAEAERDRLVAEVARQVEARDAVAAAEYRLIGELCAMQRERDRLHMLCEQSLAALTYHQQQTRPIDQTRAAIDALIAQLGTRVYGTIAAAETYAAAREAAARQEERAKLIKVLTLANAALSMSNPCAVPDCKAEQQEWKDAAMQEIDAAIRAG